MTIQFLTLRIQSILDGRANASDAQLRAIASEYMRICQNAERKLLHCASLIRARREYAAFQVAETNPMLLETLNELIFARLEDWRNFCAVRSLPCPSPFDESQISLVKSLYTREISQNHPLYRDYRRAMRMRKYPEALAVISTIVKVNGANSEAKGELEKLQKRIATQKLEEAKKAMAQNNEEEAIKIASSIREYADDFFANDESWKTLSSKIDAYERQKASDRVAEILRELRSPDIADDFRKILACAAETDVLVNKFELPLEKSEAEFLKAQTKRALAMQDEAAAAEEKAQASLEIAAEIEHPSDLGAKQALAKILKLRKKADGNLDKKIAKKLSRRISALRFKIAMSRLKKAAVFAVVAGAAVWAFMEIQKRERKESQYRAALGRMSAIENMHNTEKAAAELQKFESEFNELSRTPEFSDKIESAKKKLGAKAEYLAGLKAMLAQAEIFDKNSDDADAWDDLKMQLDAVGEQAGVLEGPELDDAKNRIAKASKTFSDAREKKRAANSAKFNALVSAAKRDIARADARNLQSIEIVEKAKAAAREARAMADNQSSIFRLTKEQGETLIETEQELEEKAEAIEGFERAIAGIKEAASAEEYFDALKNLSKSPSLSPAESASIAKILDAKDAILFEVYGGIVDLATAKAAPEKFKTQLLSLYEYPDIDKIYEATLDGAKVYTIKAPEEEKRVWNGGSEIKQKAGVIQSADGATAEKKFSKISMRSSPARGSILEGAKLSKESALAAKALETADGKSLAQALVLVANSDANPMFKLLLEKKIFDTFRKSEIESGFAFSKSMQKRAEKVDALSKDLEMCSWIFALPPRVKFIENELYKEPFADPMPEAEAAMLKAKRAAENPMALAGYADFNGKVSKKSDGEKVYGLNVGGEFSEITEIKKPAKFTPLFAAPKE